MKQEIYKGDSKVNLLLKSLVKKGLIFSMMKYFFLQIIFFIDIEKTLASLDTVINFYIVSQEVDSIIRSGPSHTTDETTNLDTFLKAMDKLQTAQEYFEKHNPQSVELENVATLFNDGGLALSREFKDLICRYSKPISPMVLLDLLGSDEGIKD